jgi:hypothetical protein
MDELQIIRGFRANVPESDSDARLVARRVLLSRIDAAPRPRRWSRLAVVVVALALAAVMAASALALYDFIAGEPAPPDVTELLVEEGTAERIVPLFAGKPNVIAEEAHGVAAVETSAGRVLLWTAPTVDGPICYFVEFARLSERKGTPQGKANCGAHLSPTAPIIFFLHLATVGERELAVVVGWTHESVGTVVLRSPEGDEQELPLSERFFVGEVPAERVPKDPRDGKPYVLIARNADGSELNRLGITEYGLAGHVDVFAPKLAGPKRTVIDTNDSRGRPLRLSFFPIEGGKTCFELKTALGTSIGCGREPRVDEGIQVHPGLRGSMVHISGSVGPEVAKLELHHQDGYVVELPLVERFVLHDVPRARFEDGKRPILLVARNRNGEEVAREKVGQAVFGPNSAIWSGRDVSP